MFQLGCEYIKPQGRCYYTVISDDYGLSFQSLHSRWPDLRALGWEEPEAKQACLFCCISSSCFSLLCLSPQKRDKGCFTISRYGLTFFLSSCQCCAFDSMFWCLQSSVLLISCVFFALTSVVFPGGLLLLPIFICPFGIGVSHTYIKS